PVQYADYALWQRKLLDGPTMAAQLEYWRAELAGLPDEIALQLDRPRPAVPSGRGGMVGFGLSDDLSERLGEFARAREGTVFMVLHAALAALLTRMGAGTDVPIGTPVTSRQDTALDNLVGFFVNTVVLRTDTSGDPSFTELLDRVRGTDLAAYANAD